AEMCQQIWVTRCEEKVQMTRLRVCRGLDAKSAAARIKAQPPQAEKVAMADVVIETNSYMRATEEQFRAAWERIPAQHREELVRRNSEKLQEKAREQLQTKTTQPKAQPVQRLNKESLKSLDLSGIEKPEAAPAAKPEPERPEGLETRRAKPSDIPSILLHIQKATGGAVKMKRAELLMSFSERSYFIGQVGAEISAIIGFSIDSQVTRIDRTFIHPLDQALVTGTAVLADIYQSAFSHLCQLIVAFVPHDAPDEIQQMYADQGYVSAEKETLPNSWQRAIDESQPENTRILLNILQPDRLKS
ncbi:MAG: dephospho-CoA kinase, partial [Anaerolineae bacterium]